VSLLALTIAVVMLAGGGFFLTLGNPTASSDPKAKGAVLLVRPDGCGGTANAEVTATAEGLVDGKSRSMNLKLVPLSAPGSYAIHRQWAEAGSWVVNVTAHGAGRSASLVVPVEKDTFRRAGAKWFPREATPDEIKAVLTGETSQATARR
jgi:hypothetical protein